MGTGSLLGPAVPPQPQRSPLQVWNPVFPGKCGKMNPWTFFLYLHWLIKKSLEEKQLCNSQKVLNDTSSTWSLCTTHALNSRSFYTLSLVQLVSQIPRWGQYHSATELDPNHYKPCDPGYIKSCIMLFLSCYHQQTMKISSFVSHQQDQPSTALQMFTSMPTKWYHLFGFYKWTVVIYTPSWAHLHAILIFI